MKRRSVSAARPGQAAPDISLERNRTVLVAIERPVIWEDSATIRCNSQTILSERKSLQNGELKGGSCLSVYTGKILVYMRSQLPPKVLSKTPI